MRSNTGALIGSAISKITGMGSYKVKSNSLMTDSQIPTFSQNKTEAFVFSASELVMDVQSSDVLSTQSWLINPTNQSLFPRLSQLANLFEQYEFLGLVFMYKPTSAFAVSSTNTALGTVILTTEYDVARPPFVSKQEAEAYEFSTSCTPPVGMLHPVECNPKQDILNSRYTQGPYVTEIPSSLGALTISDNLSNLGRLQYMAVGSQAVATVGELWVSYHVKLTKPRALPPSFPCQIQKYASSADFVFGVSISPTAENVPAFVFLGQNLGSGVNQLASPFLQNDSTMPPTLGYPVVISSPDGSSGANILLSFDGTPANTWYRIEFLMNVAGIPGDLSELSVVQHLGLQSTNMNTTQDYFFPISDAVNNSYAAGTTFGTAEWIAGGGSAYNAYFTAYVGTNDNSMQIPVDPYNNPASFVSLPTYSLAVGPLSASTTFIVATTLIITRVPPPPSGLTQSNVVSPLLNYGLSRYNVKPRVSKRKENCPPNTPKLVRTDSVPDIEDCHKKLSDRDQECWECSAIIHPCGSHRPDSYYSDLCRNCDDKYKMRAQKMK